ncbi:cyclic AMP-responsive element-binding protein 3-like protein 4 isoform X2 [Megalobrama amblycephala]|uniref:cyclic AMP-responsive element-binding protein 3-like protein 4 isoform X2 n=1 Tax=Megalobrama amblycephala TaxID=75352 RepID=UPI0020144205|nr:cyclic AMP-responsive element-binding protein 3-like protein 4 isoform X2 [Megalobrama amblycephala]
MRETDIVSGDAKSTERTDRQDGAEEAVESGLILDESCSGILFAGLDRHAEDWSVEPRCSLNDSESEEVLNAINPNEMYTSALSESDSGLSEDQYSDEQNHSSSLQPPAVYQVVYDISGVGGAIAEQQPSHMDVISIELDEWSSQMLLSESCVVNELVSSVKVENVSTHDMQNMHNPDSFLVYPELQLTEEEQKLLDQEGISLPNNLPLTKAEERILKKVRRKIRNKLSAQDSRRRKKEYIDGLESRVAACSAQNKELQRTVTQLEKHNMSLMAQLHKLQALIKQTATKAAQTSTCIMILIFSLALLIFPSYSPFSRSSQSLEDSYAPSGVMSRNILNDAGSPALLEDAGEDEPMVSVPTELKLSDTDWDSDGPQQPEEALIGEQKNGTAVTGADADTLSVALTAPVAAGNADAAKPPHADEM